MPDSNETLLREVLASVAVVTARLEDLAHRQGDASKDAREARDLSNRIAAILEEQNIGARLVELRTEQRQSLAELRVDVVAANTNVLKKLSDETAEREAADDALSERIKVLEAERNKVVGVATFFGWLSRHAPWLLAGIAAFAAGLGFKGTPT
jgi:hypothetical protein